MDEFMLGAKQCMCETRHIDGLLADYLYSGLI